MAAPINASFPVLLPVSQRLGSLQNLGVPSEVLSVPWGAEPRKGQPCIPRTRVRRGRCRREGPTGKKRQILPVASSSLPPGLTCPDVLRYRWVSTDAPHALSLLSSYKILNLDYLTYILKIFNLTTFNTQLSLFHHFQESQNCTVYKLVYLWKIIYYTIPCYKE